MDARVHLGLHPALPNTGKIAEIYERWTPFRAPARGIYTPTLDILYELSRHQGSSSPVFSSIIIDNTSASIIHRLP